MGRVLGFRPTTTAEADSHRASPDVTRGRSDRSTAPGRPAGTPEQETDAVMTAVTHPRPSLRVRARPEPGRASGPARSSPTCRPPRCTRPPSRDGEGLIAAEGPLVVSTGTHTGRSPKDKFIVREPSSEANVWWGDVNHPISEEHYDRLRARLMAYLAERRLYSQDLFIGAHPTHRRSLRVYTETAWASIFARNLFRRPTRGGPRRASPRTSRSSTSRRSRPTPPPRAPGPAPRSSSTSSGWRSSSSGRCTPARSRSRRSRS